MLRSAATARRARLAARGLLLASLLGRAVAGTLCYCADGADGAARRRDDFCSWTGFSGIPYVPQANQKLVQDLLPKSCTDKRLSVQDQAFCNKCCSLKTRKDCLGTIGRSWHNGEDTQSCSWMSRNKAGLSVREVEYKLGINFPWNIANVINPKTCREERLYTVLSEPDAYSATYFSVVAVTSDPNATISRPPGLAPDASCIVRPPQRTCTVNFLNSDDVFFVTSSRDMWTQKAAIIRSLRSPGNDDCLYRHGAKCVPASTPFRYRLHLTVHPCPVGKRPPEVVVSKGEMPLSEPGVLLKPGGSPLNYKETGFFLQGARRATWNITATKAKVLVAVVSQQAAFKACPLADGGASTAWCNYRGIQRLARRGTYCYARQCVGSLENRAGTWNSTEFLLVTAGLAFPNREEQFPKYTVQQSVWADVRTYPALQYDAMSVRAAVPRMASWDEIEPSAPYALPAA